MCVFLCVKVSVLKQSENELREKKIFSSSYVESNEMCSHFSFVVIFRLQRMFVVLDPSCFLNKFHWARKWH